MKVVLGKKNIRIYLRCGLFLMVNCERSLVSASAKLFGMTLSNDVIFFWSRTV